MRREVIDLGAVAVFHPACGSHVLVTHVGFTEDGVRIEAICPTCDRYVYLLWACADPIASDQRGRPAFRPAGVERAPRPDVSRDAVIEELETLLTQEYLRLALRKPRQRR